MTDFLSGAIAMGFGAAGLFFLRFWARTRDALFVYFAAAFWIMALNRLAFSLLRTAHEAHIYLYGMRLAAFSLLAFGIMHKNRGRG